MVWRLGDADTSRHPRASIRRFLRRLVQGAERKLFVILDRLRVHRAKRVTAWLRANAARIELFSLPPDAPEHNPDGFLHNDVSQALARRRIARDKAARKSHLRSHMRGLQRRPAKLRALPGAHAALRGVEQRIIPRLAEGDSRERASPTRLRCDSRW
jgi:hypothetical protein